MFRQLTDTFAELGKSYAKVILDTPRDSLKAVAQAAKAAAGKYGRVRAIVVMHPHDMALRAAEITGRELEELGIAEKHLVINSFDADAVKKGTRPGIVELIDRASIPLIGVIPYDSDITSAQNDGRLIRLIFPQATEERRKALCKDVAKMGEECKVNLRNIRRDANDKCKDMKKKSEMTEDEQKSSEKAVQDLTDKYIKQVDGIVDKKSKEIMSI